MKLRQIRFVHVGVIGALLVAGATGVGIVSGAGAAGGTASTFLPITPCRLLDTRTGAENVGTRSTPLIPAETATFSVWGTNGNCTIPTTATGIVSNATAVNPTADSYVTFFPADALRPTASNLNVVAGSPPTPNQVTVGLSAAGKISVYNNGGTLDLIVDIVGYYEPATNGTVTTTTQPAPAEVTQYFNGGQAWPLGADVLRTSQDCVKIQASFLSVTLSLDLPSGAVLNTVQVRYLDQTTGTLRFNLYYAEPGITTSEVNITPSALDSIGTNSSDFHRSGEFVMNAHPPAGSNAQYYVTALSLSGTGTVTSVAFCGVFVTYTLPAT